MHRQLSLRARLILGVIALAAIGLVAADFATYSALRSFLMKRTDSSLQAAHVSVENVRLPHEDRDRDHAAGRPPDFAPLTAAAPATYVALRRADGTLVRGGSAPRFPGGTRAPPPALPRHIALPTKTTPQGERVAYFTVAATSGGDRYRARASIEPQAPNYVLVVAQSLSDVDSTLHRLLWIALLVTLLVLAGIALLGSWVVRVGLRPLAAIGATASEIA